MKKSESVSEEPRRVAHARMTDKKREEHRQVQGMEAESDPDTSSNMFMSLHRPCCALSCKKAGHRV